MDPVQGLQELRSIPVSIPNVTGLSLFLAVAHMKKELHGKPSKRLVHWCLQGPFAIGLAFDALIDMPGPKYLEAGVI